MSSDIMTVEELAEYLKLDAQTIYRKFRRGELPGVKIGKSIRFKREVIESWLRAMSYGWDAARREELRNWAGEFARKQGLREREVQAAIRARRRAPR
jgi:excisionase family DNA binding protein